MVDAESPLTDVINTMTYSPFTSGPISTDHENVVKAFSVLPSTLGRGHTLMDPDGPPWVSDVKST